MTEQDKILEIAQQAGLGEFLQENKNDSVKWFGFNKTAIKEFAKLIEQNKINEIATKCEKLPFGDTAHSFANWIREQ
jgi:hypothetical protein